MNKKNKELIRLGKITINELDESLIELIGNGGNGGNVDISGKQDKYDTALNTTNDTVVGAINEVNNLAQSTSVNVANCIASIGDRTSLVTTNKETLVGAINEIASNGSFSGSTGGADINNTQIITEGGLTDDVYASHGKAYIIMTSSNKTSVLYSSILSDIKFGHYALCLRMKLGTTTTEDVCAVTLIDGNRTVATKTFNGADFDNITNYNYLYTTFQYDGTGTNKSNLIIRIETLPTSSSIELRFDYVYVNMIMPSIYL